MIIRTRGKPQFRALLKETEENFSKVKRGFEVLAYLSEKSRDLGRKKTEIFDDEVDKVRAFGARCEAAEEIVE